MVREILGVSVEGREVERGGIVSGMEDRGDIVNGIVCTMETETEVGIVERIVDMGRVIVSVGMIIVGDMNVNVAVEIISGQA